MHIQWKKQKTTIYSHINVCVYNKITEKDISIINTIRLWEKKGRVTKKTGKRICV
jgi:hypothetical protein